MSNQIVMLGLEDACNWNGRTSYETLVDFDFGNLVSIILNVSKPALVVCSPYS
jgi:hypothetical protein